MSPLAAWLAMQGPPQGPGPDFSGLFENLARIAFFLFLFVFPVLGAVLKKLREKAQQGQAKRDARGAPRVPETEAGRSAAELEGRDLWRELLEGNSRERTAPTGDVIVAELERADAVEAAEALERERERRAVDARSESAREGTPWRSTTDPVDAEDAGRREREAHVARQSARLRELEEARRRASARPAAEGWGEASAAPVPLGQQVGSEWLGADTALAGDDLAGLGSPSDRRGDLVLQPSSASERLAPVDEDALEAGWRPEARSLVQLSGFGAAQAAAVPTASRSAHSLRRVRRSQWRRAVLLAEVLGPPVGLREANDPLGALGLRRF